MNRTAGHLVAGQHPHKGFETVTIAYQGKWNIVIPVVVAVWIKAGDVQWMTAGAGIIHQEFHSALSRRGGMFEMVQIFATCRVRIKMYRHIIISTSLQREYSGGGICR